MQENISFLPVTPSPHTSYKAYTSQQLVKIEKLQQIPQSLRRSIEVLAKVFPFRVNDHFLGLIDWANPLDDPLFRLVFPQKAMLDSQAYDHLEQLLQQDADKKTIDHAVTEIRNGLNPHPAGQMDLNIPYHRGQALAGSQHKYKQTLLFFPSQGQVCHAYCTFCFRWAQFIGDKELKFAAKDADLLLEYLKEHTEITDLLFTGGDPMVMKSHHLKNYLDILDHPALDHIQTVRLGTKALSFWPQRFVSDEDSSQLLGALRKLVVKGKHVAVMAHLNHWRELESPVTQEAIARIRATGAQIRSQGPLLNHINNDAETWARMWQQQVKLGIIPYYMFVERDTGARQYFEVPLVQAWQIYRDAVSKVSGLARTVRGPSMSCEPGKIEISGISEIQGEKVIVLRFIQARNDEWIQKPFFAKYDEKATWFDQLKPAFGEKEFFWEADYRKICEEKKQLASDQQVIQVK